VFGINGFEFVAIAVVALLLLGPDKLPRYAGEAARFVKQMRKMAANAQSEVRKELGPEFQDISVKDLNPKSFVSKHLFDGDMGLDDLTDLGLDDDRPSNRRSGAAYARSPRRANGATNGSGNGAAVNGSTAGSVGAAGGSTSSGSTAADAVPSAPIVPPYDADAT
jgi:sec-independent protein translocase protein TatB